MFLFGEKITNAHKVNARAKIRANSHTYAYVTAHHFTIRNIPDNTNTNYSWKWTIRNFKKFYETPRK